ncbi:MAG: diguanylate cyclase domain-containing protein [Acidimicrobiales bacterium]
MTEEQERAEFGAVRTLMRLPRLRPEPDQPAAEEHPRITSEADWEPSNARGPTRKRTEILTYASGVIGILELWLLGRTHVVAERPLWLLLAVLAGAAGAGWVGDMFYRSHPSAKSLHLRVACQTVSVTAIIYLVGWGPALAIGYAFPLLNTSYFVGRRGRWALAIWPVLCLGAGQLAVGLGAVPLLISNKAANGLAVVDVFAILFVWFQISQLTAGKEIAERELTFAASHDSLTGLLNRSALATRLEGLVAGTNRRERPVAVMFCDMLGFKDVNDCFGHESGDKALAEVSRRLRATFREDDLVARFAGDEFVVALAAPTEPGSVVSAAERMLDALEVPVRLGSGSVLLGMSIGIAFSSTGRMGVDRLLAEADQAMYEAKALHRSSWVLRELE